METKTKVNAAAQEAAAPQTVATATTSTETAKPATAAKITIVTRKVPKKRAAAAAKPVKVAKRLVGDLVFIATISYNHWRSFVSNLLNTTLITGAVHTASLTEDMEVIELETPVAAFRADETVLTHKTKTGEEVNTIWAGHIAVKPENVAKVTAQLNAITETNKALPLAEQDIVLWNMLETPINVPAKPRAPRKPKASAEVSTEVVSTEVATEVAEEVTEEVVA